MAYASEGSIAQKSTSELIAEEHNLGLVKLLRFDVAEESFDFALTPSILGQRVPRVVSVDSDLLLLIGCPPSVFVVLADRLRSVGYEGVIAATYEIRGNTSLRHQPYIVSLTPNTLGETREVCQNTGIDDSFTKPVTLQDFKDALLR